MQKHTLRRLPLLIAAFASEWIYAADTAQNAEQVQLEEVVVTGERTNRSGFETATSNRVFTTPNIDRSQKEKYNAIKSSLHFLFSGAGCFWRANTV